MIEKSYARAVERAFNIWARRDNFCYLYGAKGQRITPGLFEYLVKSEPAHFSKYTAEELERIKNNCIGKIGVDCSGLIALCVDWLPGTYSTGYYNNRKKDFESITAGTAGALVYTTFGGKGRHIGIDVGSGFFIHAGNEFDGVQLCKFSDYPGYWEKSFELNGVDYAGASSVAIDKERG